jgi:uncharacterized protein YoxC
MASVNESTAYIEELTEDIDAATSCQAIQGYVDTAVKDITSVIEQKTESITNIASQWAPLVDLPTDPLDILTWASKVVGGPIAAQVELMAKQAIELAQLAGALAGLASSVTSAVDRLQFCTEQAVLSAMRDIENELIDQANKALAKAETIKDDILEKAGITDVTDEIQGVVDDVSEVGGTLDNVENTVDGLPNI